MTPTGCVAVLLKCVLPEAVLVGGKRANAFLSPDWSAKERGLNLAGGEGGGPLHLAICHPLLLLDCFPAMFVCLFWEFGWFSLGVRVKGGRG